MSEARNASLCSRYLPLESTRFVSQNNLEQSDRVLIMAQALRVASGTNILKWKVGDFTVTSIPESEAKTTPKFLFKEVDKKALSKIGDEHTWLKPTYVTPDGLMLQKVQALICDNGKIRMVVDTCVGSECFRQLQSLQTNVFCAPSNLQTTYTFSRWFRSETTRSVTPPDGATSKLRSSKP